MGKSRFEKSLWRGKARSPSSWRSPRSAICLDSVNSLLCLVSGNCLEALSTPNWPVARCSFQFLSGDGTGRSYPYSAFGR